MLKWLIGIFVVSLVIVILLKKVMQSYPTKDEVDKFYFGSHLVSIMIFLSIFSLSFKWFCLYKSNVSAVAEIPNLTLEYNTLYQKMKVDDTYSLKIDFDEVSNNLKIARQKVKDYEEFRKWIW